MPRTTLHHVLKRAPANNLAYVLLLDPKSRTNLLLSSRTRSVKPTNFDRLRIFNFCCRAFLSISVWVPFPIRSISSIFNGSSHINMVRVAADSVIAFVKDPHPFWNWAIDELPRNPVSTLRHCVEAHSPVSQPLVSQKWPAFIRAFDFDLVPKSFWHWKFLHALRVVNFQF